MAVSFRRITEKSYCLKIDGASKGFRKGSRFIPPKVRYTPTVAELAMRRDAREDTSPITLDEIKGKMAARDGAKLIAGQRYHKEDIWRCPVMMKDLAVAREMPPPLEVVVVAAMPRWNMWPSRIPVY